MASGDECTLRIVGRYQEQNIVNTMHYRISSQASSDLLILKQLVSGWLSNYQSAWTNCHVDDYELIGIKAFGKTGTAKTPAFSAVSASGAVTGDGHPAFVCRTITLYTADPKHRRRGRLMLSGTPVSHIDTTDGSLTASAETIMNALAAALIGTLSVGSDEFQPGIPAVGTDTWQDFVDYLSRQTPSAVTSRRIRQFLIG